MYDEYVDGANVNIDQLLAEFMANTVLIHRYLQQHGSLTPSQIEALTFTINQLQESLVLWKNQHNG
jgi:hypothetical protein